MGKVTSMTRKGQVTIPKEVREALGLRPFDKVEIFLEYGEAKLRRVLPLREVAGSLPLPSAAMPLEEAIHVAKDDRARKFITRGAGLKSPRSAGWRRLV